MLGEEESGEDDGEESDVRSSESEEEERKENFFDPRVTSNLSKLALREDGLYYCLCNKQYKHRAGYSRHKNKCSVYLEERERYREYIKKHQK